MTNISPRATEFAVFCIENTAKRLGVSGAKLYQELQRIGAISSFVYPSYPTLHTQGKEYIVDEMIEYIRKHNPKFVEGKENIA